MNAQSVQKRKPHEVSWSLVCVCTQYQLPILNQHGIHENITWHAKMSQMLFSRIQGGLNWFLKVAFANYNWMYLQTLVACASDKEGRSLFIS